MVSYDAELPQLPGYPLNLDPIERAMLAMSYGVHVIGSFDGESTHNVMIADWAMQVSFKPRLVAVSIENDARTLRYVRQTKAFSVNMLHQKDGAAIAKRVVMPAEGRKIKGRSEAEAVRVHDKLSGLRHQFDAHNCPILLDALGWYSCEVEQFVETGDHTIVVGRVTDGAVQRDGEMLTERELGWEYAG